MEVINQTKLKSWQPLQIQYNTLKIKSCKPYKPVNDGPKAVQPSCITRASFLACLAWLYINRQTSAPTDICSKSVFFPLFSHSLTFFLLFPFQEAQNFAFFVPKSQNMASNVQVDEPFSHAASQEPPPVQRKKRWATKTRSGCQTCR